MEEIKKRGRKKGWRANDVQTVPLNVRVSKEAREILNTVSRYKIGQFISELIIKSKENGKR